MNPTPTDPREEQPKIVGYRSIAVWPRGEVNLGDPNNESDDSHGTEEQARTVCRLLEQNGFGGNGRIFPLSTRVEPIYSAPTESTNSKLAAENTVMRGALGIQPDETIPEQTPQFGNILVDRQGSRRRIAPATENEEKLAAEIAELKAKLEHYGSVAEWMGKPTSDLHTELIRLRAELEAARKERDERKADLKMFMEMHDTALAAKDAAEKENKELREREGQLVIKWEGQQDRANQLESKLATLCAAKEKRVAEALPIISDALSELSLTLANTERRESADCRLAAYLKASRASELIAALTPAPTQEPPAGGVTISNDIERPIEVAGANDEGQKSQPSDVTISTEKKGGEAGMFIESPPMKGASDVRPEGRPADVPSEGRGEWMPIETAPKTGDDLHAIEILGWIPDASDIYDGGDRDVVYWEPSEGKWFCRGHEVDTPTHWTPLPPPPMLPTEGSGA